MYEMGAHIKCIYGGAYSYIRTYEPVFVLWQRPQNKLLKQLPSAQNCDCGQVL